MPSDIVRVQSVAAKDAQPYRLTFGRDVYEFKPGDSFFVPLEVAATWFGDPRIANQSPGSRNRQEHFERKRAYWDFHMGYDTEEDWEAKKPPFEVWSTDPEPQRVYMLLDDPDGTREAPALTVVTQEKNTNTFLARIDALTAEVEQLRQLQADTSLARIREATDPRLRDEPDVAVGPTETLVPDAPIDSDASEDTPNEPPSGRRR